MGSQETAQDNDSAQKEEGQPASDQIAEELAFVRQCLLEPKCFALDVHLGSGA